MLRRAVLISACVILIFLIPLRLSTSLRSFTLHTISPITRPLIAANRKITIAWNGLRGIPQLQAQRADLQAQVVSLQEKLIDEQRVNEENATLRKELGVRGGAQQDQKVLARVIVQGTDPVDQTLTVDVGTNQGVTLGLPATTQGVLIGRVSQVSRQSSVVRLITSNRSLVQAKLSSDGQKGLVRGTGTGTELDDVQQGITENPGSSIETSGLGGSLPSGILIGQIGSTTSKPSSSTQSFQVTMPFNPTELSAFFIVLTGSSS